MVSTQNDCVLATRKTREIRFRTSNTVLNTSNLSRFCSAFFLCFYFVIAYERNALTFNRMHAAVYSHVFCMPTSPVEYLLLTAAHILCTSSLSIDHEKKKRLNVVLNTAIACQAYNSNAKACMECQTLNKIHKKSHSTMQGFRNSHIQLCGSRWPGGKSAEGPF